MNRPLLKSIALVTVLGQLSAHAAPVLEIDRSGNNIILKWPIAYSDWYVQSSTTLKADSWGPLFQQVVINNGNHVLTYPLSGQARFFRLAQKDLPDGSFTDVNGDGIDGDANLAIFVVASGGNDNNPGTRALPMATLPAAITKAASQGKDVYAGKGTYTFANALVLANGVSLYGQFDPNNNWTRSVGNTTTISGGTTAVLAQNLTIETHVEGFTIKSTNATSAGGSSYGVRVVSSAGPVILSHNNITAGNGAAGSAGGSGANGAPGGDGANGTGGFIDTASISGNGGLGGTSPVGRPGGKGGKGGFDPSYWGSPGLPGTGGAAGGAGGAPGDPGQQGKEGNDGADGVPGTSGMGGSDFGSIGSSGYTVRNGNTGTAGTDGHGGGGGGGGGGQDCTFCDNGGGNGGGGGGGGGEGGNAGGPGGGGGGSFGVLTYNSTVTLYACIITTGSGGAGGKGGNGGLGGAGGDRGLGDDIGVVENELQRGGHGGYGGAGGRGGNGGGGGGGPSIGVAKTGGSVVSSNNAYFIGAGGNGGAGGTNGGPSFSGSKGLSAQTN